MKTILDLLREFVTLNEAKVGQGGKLPPEPERRWAELKRIYDLLMGENGISRGTVTRRFGRLRFVMGYRDGRTYVYP